MSMPTSPDGAQHCEHWFEGSDECHRCGHFPMMERLAAGVAYLHKQNGGIRPKSNGRRLDGRTWDQYPTAVQS